LLCYAQRASLDIFINICSRIWSANIFDFNDESFLRMFARHIQSNNRRLDLG